MDNNNNTSAWVIGGIIVLLLIGGFFWWKSMNTAPTTPADQNTTTDQTTTPPNVEAAGVSTSTVSQIIANLPEASQFAALFASSGVSASLSPTGKYTVFVPTNGAFALLAPGTIDRMSAAQRKQLAQYHVVTKKLDIDAVNNGSITALSKDILNFMVSDKGTSVQVDSAFAIKSYEGVNGIVYLINGVLIPPEKATQ